MLKIVLLQTAEALISSKNNNREGKVRTLLDRRAQSSFINEEISKKFNLPTVTEIYSNLLT